MPTSNSPTSRFWSSDASAPTVLVADDEKNVRLTLKQALEDLGLAVETASDGTEALNCLEKGDYDLMLLDLRMPGMGGLEVLQQARRSSPDLPIVIVTAHGTVQNAVQAMRRGAVDVLLKPLSLESIRALVDRVLRRPSVEEETAPYDEWMRLATWHVRHHRTQAARHCLREAIDQEDTRPEAYTLLGILEGTAGNVEAAREHLQAAVERKPDAATARLLLDRLQEEGAVFPVDRPPPPPDAVTSDSDSTAKMRAVSEPAATEEEVSHRVLAVLDERIADGATASDRALTQIAASSARAHANGELLLLTVVEVPWQLSLSQAEEARRDHLQEVQRQLEVLAKEEVGDTLPVRPIVVVAHQTASVLKNVIADREVQHLVGAWSQADEDSPGEAPGWTDALDDIACELTLLRAPADATADTESDVTAFVSDSPYAPFVARRALEWAQGSGVASLTLLTIQADDGAASKEDLRHRGKRLLWDVADRAGLEEEQYEGRVLVATEVEAAAERCARACDRICVGASRSSAWAESVFGSFPEHLIESSECPVALVRGPQPSARSFLEDLGHRLSGA